MEQVQTYLEAIKYCTSQVEWLLFINHRHEKYNYCRSTKITSNIYIYYMADLVFGSRRTLIGC